MSDCTGAVGAAVAAELSSTLGVSSGFAVVDMMCERGEGRKERAG